MRDSRLPLPYMKNRPPLKFYHLFPTGVVGPGFKHHAAHHDCLVGLEVFYPGHGAVW